MRHLRTIVLIALASLGISGCGHSHVYSPATTTTAILEGRPAAYVRIPPEAPRGDVRIATFGIAGLHKEEDRNGDDEVRALHVRMAVANNSDTPWVIDTREQRVTLPDHGESRAAYAAVDKGAAPIVTIPPGEEREIDLFFPLPEHLEKTSKLPKFDLVWKVQTGDRVVLERAPFERLTVEPMPDPYYYRGWGYGWAPPYYYDPYYWRGGAFYGVRFGAPVWVGPPVIEHRGTVRQAPPAR